MTPIAVIKKRLVQEPVVIDIEVVGARLEHHKVEIAVSNTFSSDVGDKWQCALYFGEEIYRSTKSSLRASMIDAFEQLEKG